uniref:Uncharacterized protein n=1 Tax=Rhizophora mucronata TaxID=61149 RepID=A0A2P2PYQ0_RHIMU
MKNVRPKIQIESQRENKEGS